MAKSRPKIFGTETASVKKIKAEKLTNLKNIGKVLEQVLSDVGINSVSQFKKLGWLGVMNRLVVVHPRFQQTIYVEVMMGAIQGVPWHQISKADKKKALKYIESLDKN